MRKMLISLLLLLPGFAFAADAVLVTAAKGAVQLEVAGTAGKTTLEPFIRLQAGDRLHLSAGATLSLVFVGVGRVESWQGPGTLLVGEGESRAVAGKPIVQTRQIPAEVARQMNKTPSQTQDGRVGMMRMRAIPPADAITRLEREYAALREKAPTGDITPDLYLLAGLYDLRQYDRLRSELERLGRDYPKDPNAAALRQLYEQAIAATTAPAR